MYQVLCDGHPLLDWRDNDLILVNPRVKLAVNTVGEASFTMHKNHPHYDKLKRSRSVFEISDEIGTIFRGRMTGDTLDFDNGKAVDLEGAMAYFNDSIVRPFTFPDDFLTDAGYIAATNGGNVIQFFLNWLITNHNNQVQEFQRFKLGNVAVTDPNNYLYRYSTSHANTWETLKSKLFDSALGGYLCIRYEADGNYIDYLSEFDQTNTQEIVFGENLMDLKNETDNSATYSAIIPIGKDVERTISNGKVEGEYVDFDLTETIKEKLNISALPDGNVTEDIVKKGDTLYSVSAVNQIGWIYAPTSETTWNDVEKAESLLTKGIEWLRTHGMMSSNTIEVTAVDLHFSDAEISSFRMYRNINVRSAPHDVVSTYPLAELDIDLLNPQNTKITVGESRMTLIDKQYSENTNTADKIVDMTNQGALVGIANVKKLYYLSTSTEELMGGEWVAEEPAREEGKYLWTRDVILYTDKSTYESQPSCNIGAKGEKGDTGTGVSSVLLEFYLSDSSTTQSGGEWLATTPEWTEGKYLWTRNVIYYTDGSKSYTAPVCDTTWEAVTDLDEKLDQTEVFNRLTNNGALQGLYMANGKLYINAEYIQSLEKMFAKDITMTGKFECTAQAYLPPTHQDAIDTLYASFNMPGYEHAKIDLNGDGSVDVQDADLAMEVWEGDKAMSSCRGAQKSTVTVCVDMSNPEKAIRIYGTNMWGTLIENYIGTEINRSSFASRERLDNILNCDDSFAQNATFFRDNANKRIYLNPPMQNDVEYPTYDQHKGELVTKKLDSATGRLLWKAGSGEWNTYAKLMGSAPAGLSSTYVSASTEAEITARLSEVYASTADNTVKIFFLSITSTGLTLAGGGWFVTIYRTTSQYGYVEAVCYGDTGGQKFINSMWGGSWIGWKNASLSRFVTVGNAPAVSAKRGALSTPGWYKIGYASCDKLSMSIVETYAYTGSSVHSFDIIKAHNKAKIINKEFVPTITTAEQFTKIALKFTTTSTYDIYLYYAPSAYNEQTIYWKTDNGNWTYTPCDYEAVTVNESEMSLVEALGEWVNPPLKLGVVYRTLERWNGKVVYVKMLDFGLLPNNNKKAMYVDDGITDLVRVDGDVEGSLIALATAPFIKEISIVNSNSLQIITNTDASAIYTSPVVYYCKG